MYHIYIKLCSFIIVIRKFYLKQIVFLFKGKRLCFRECKTRGRGQGDIGTAEKFAYHSVVLVYICDVINTVKIIVNTKGAYSLQLADGNLIRFVIGAYFCGYVADTGLFVEPLFHLYRSVSICGGAGYGYKQRCHYKQGKQEQNKHGIN